MINLNYFTFFYIFFSNIVSKPQNKHNPKILTYFDQMQIFYGQKSRKINIPEKNAIFSYRTLT